MKGKGKSWHKPAVSFKHNCLFGSQRALFSLFPEFILVFARNTRGAGKNHFKEKAIFQLGVTGKYAP